MPHYDSRKALHDPNPPPRLRPPPGRRVTLDVDAVPAKLAVKIRRQRVDERPTLVRLNTERLLDYLETNGYAPSDIDMAVERFVERLRAAEV
jgi:hypothetical protein